MSTDFLGLRAKSCWPGAVRLDLSFLVRLGKTVICKKGLKIAVNEVVLVFISEDLSILLHENIGVNCCVRGVKNILKILNTLGTLEFYIYKNAQINAEEAEIVEEIDI